VTNPILPSLPPSPPADARPMFGTLSISASGLSAQRFRMDTIATNIANAETTHTADGGPYRRRTVEMQAADGAGVQVTGVSEDATAGPLVYDPGHPDANADGYVRYPNVSVTDEMVGLMDARRMYEANATVFQATKSMLKAAIDI
jgi:flagellar basal-body rod protein FlgC